MATWPQQQYLKGAMQQLLYIPRSQFLAGNSNTRALHGLISIELHGHDNISALLPTFQIVAT